MLDSSQGKIHATHTTQRALDMYFFHLSGWQDPGSVQGFWWERWWLLGENEGVYQHLEPFGDIRNQKPFRLPSKRFLRFVRLDFWIQARWWFQFFFYFHPYLGKISNLNNIFQMGWNHQLARYFQMGFDCCHVPALKVGPLLLGRFFGRWCSKFLGWTDLGSPKR